MDNVALGQIFPGTSVSLANPQSTKFSILTITRGKYNRPEETGVPSEPSMNSIPPLCELKIKKKVSS
jgi:hypothetical protein